MDMRKTADLFAPPMDPISDGRLTLEGFSVAARAFADKWKRHNQSFPPWSWVPLINRTLLVSNKEEGYLSLEKIFILSSLEESPEEESLDVTPDFLDKEESIDHTILVQNVENEAHYYDFHIVYSASYGVPVLYFRGYCSDGKPLSLDVIKKDLPSSSVSLLLESKWTFITQEEHPYLNRPWFKLHPCGTEEWIKLLSQRSSSGGCQMPVELYLVSWFSVVGQVVGLRITLEMLN
ncbi:ubiquitin-like-conjugating enzyme ATG10 isoform X2 [Eutrema salsugineum]|uniref:ubiquitin-like-conjugating enzyme ATG10 isoform X2 n=1 Tax=Eutrema salsugineum TaxID=72664 RepID=UPI000CED32FA|nr:ubiquitin-like-conjugating enzyme ATG10 isoform X2 [Eutrema salsugineum]